MDTFFIVRNNQTYLNRYAWANTILWTDFALRPQCEICGDDGAETPGGFDVVVGQGSKYPDILGCGHVPYFILSDRAVETWKRHGITNFDQYRVTVRIAKPKLLRGVTPPTYWRIEPRGKCAVDLEAKGLIPERWCEEHKRYRRKITIHVSKTVLVPGTWDGSDLFRDVNYSRYVVMCTKRLADICIAEKLLCFRFDRLDKAEIFPGKGDLYTK